MDNKSLFKVIIDKNRRLSYYDSNGNRIDEDVDNDVFIKAYRDKFYSKWLSPETYAKCEEYEHFLAASLSNDSSICDMKIVLDNNIDMSNISRVRMSLSHPCFDIKVSSLNNSSLSSSFSESIEFEMLSIIDNNENSKHLIFPIEWLLRLSLKPNIKIKNSNIFESFDKNSIRGCWFTKILMILTFPNNGIYIFIISYFIYNTNSYTNTNSRKY